ncbi:unnamed protein product [Discula destructiva]
MRSSHQRVLALLAVSHAVAAQEYHYDDPTSKEPSFITGVDAPTFTQHGGPLTTTAYVTATTIYQLEVVSICTTDGVATTILQESTACETYSTIVTIPESLCETFVSTLDNGGLTTCTTPVLSWTECLTTQSTSTVHGITVTETTPVKTSVPAEYTPAAISQAAAISEAAAVSQAAEISQAAAVSQAGSQGVSPVESSPAKTTYVQSGAGRVPAPLLSVCISWLAWVLV